MAVSPANFRFADNTSRTGLESSYGSPRLVVFRTTHALPANHRRWLNKWIGMHKAAEIMSRELTYGWPRQYSVSSSSIVRRAST